MTKLSAWKKACAVFLLCAATAIAASAQTFTTLVVFNYSDGIFPIGLVQGTDGKFYGPASLGGTIGYGTVYKFGPSRLTSLYNFCEQRQGDMCLDGVNPDALVLATDLNLYGTTGAGGADGYGTFFKIGSGGTLTTLYTFGSGGGSPTSGLVQAAGNRPGPLRDFYLSLLEKGMRPTMARLTLARKIASITLTIWKKGVDFDAKQLHRQAA